MRIGRVFDQKSCDIGVVEGFIVYCCNCLTEGSGGMSIGVMLKR